MNTERIEKLLEKCRNDNEVLAVILFGSMARGDQKPDSDIDICLILMQQKKPYEPISLSNKRIEYLGQFDLDLHIFQQLPIYIRRNVIKDGKVLLVKDEDMLYDVAFRTAQKFEDFKHIYNDYLAEVAKGGTRTYPGKN
jgi:predicted nucleotidyltransferase